MEAILIGGLTNAIVATLMAAACLGLTCVWRNPYVARGLWLAVLVKLVTPPLVELPVAWLQTPPAVDHQPMVVQPRFANVPIPLLDDAAPMRATPPLAGPVGASESTGPDSDEAPMDGVRAAAKSAAIAPPVNPIRTRDVAVGVWLAGAVCLFGVAGLRILRFHRMVRRTKPAPPSVLAQASEIAARLGLARFPRLCLVDSRLPPLVWSVGRGTTILLPARLFNQLSADKRAAVLAHELMHVRRRDHWIRWIEAAVVCVFWWHPVAWLARHKLQAAEERCCDADVLRALPQFRRGYAEALLETLDFLAGARPAAALATGFTQRSSVVRRFEMIVQSRPAARPLLSVRGAILGVVLLVLSASPVASPAHPEGKPTGKAPDGIPCTVTLKDGTTMEGFIVRLADDRVVIRRRAEPVAEEADEPTEQKTPTISENEAKHEFWDLELSECVSISLKNSDVIRQLKVSFSDDELVLLGEEGGQSRLLDTRSGVEGVLRDVETAYWELWRCHRALEAVKSGRDAALKTWRVVYDAYKSGDKDALAGREAQAKEQYFAFRNEVESAGADVRRAESRLRYLLGLVKTDGRLIRPADEPNKDKVELDWKEIHEEALSNRVELQKQRQAVAKRELELKSARDKVLGPLKAARHKASLPPTLIRHHELLVAREKAVLRDTELEVSHQVADAERDIDRDYKVAQSRLNAVVAAQDEVEAVRAEFFRQPITLDLLLDAQRRRADAERNLYSAIADHALSIMHLHMRKGSLLERHGVSIQAR